MISTNGSFASTCIRSAHQLKAAPSGIEVHTMDAPVIEQPGEEGIDVDHDDNLHMDRLGKRQQFNVRPLLEEVGV